jgi:hypothetical protein
MRYLNGVFALTLALQASPASVLAQDKPDKKDLIENVIPEEIRNLFDSAKGVLNFVGGIGQVIDAAGALSQLLGLTEAGPSIDEQFYALSEQLERVKDELVERQHSAAAAARFAHISAAVYSLMEALADPDGDQYDYYIGRANVDSKEVMEELARSFSTPSSWGTMLEDKDGNSYYDWQLSVPELMQSIAMRLVVIKALDPSWQLNPDRIAEVHEYRDWLKGHADAMHQGIRSMYSSSSCNDVDDIVGVCVVETWIGCHDPSSGASNLVHLDGTLSQEPQPPCALGVLQQIGQPTIIDVIAQLDGYLAGR